MGVLQYAMTAAKGPVTCMLPTSSVCHASKCTVTTPAATCCLCAECYALLALEQVLLPVSHVWALSIHVTTVLHVPLTGARKQHTVTPWRCS